MSFDVSFEMFRVHPKLTLQRLQHIWYDATRRKVSLFLIETDRKTVFWDFWAKPSLVVVHNVGTPIPKSY